MTNEGPRKKIRSFRSACEVQFEPYVRSHLMAILNDPPFTSPAPMTPARQEINL